MLSRIRILGKVMDINLTKIPPKGQEIFPIPLGYPSLRQSLADYLPAVIPAPAVGSVFRLRQPGTIVYRCRLVLEHLPQSWPESLWELEGCGTKSQKSLDPNNDLTSAFSLISGTPYNTPAVPCLWFKASWEQPPWLDFVLPDEQLLRWLDHLWRWENWLSWSDSPIQPMTRLRNVAPDYFPLQYAHARCWAAICQAQVTGDSRQEANSPHPPFVPKDNFDRDWFRSNLRLDAPTRSLIQSWVEFVDQQDCPKPATRNLIAHQLGYAALEYLRHGALRIAATPSEQRQAQLGLVILVQQSLQWLLEMRYGQVARREL